MLNKRRCTAVRLAHETTLMSTSSIIKEMQIKTTLRYRHTSFTMAKIWNTDNAKCWQGCWTTGTLIRWWWERRMVQPLWKTVCQFLTKLNIPHYLAITLPGIYPEEMFTEKPAHRCLRPLFIIATTWKQPRCPSGAEWINKLWHNQTME